MIVVGVAFVGMDGRALRQIQFQVLENLDVGLRSGRQGELHRLAFSAYNQMHPQSVEVATLARDVAPEVHALRVRGIESTATDTDVVAHRDRQGVHYISAVGVSLLEELGQHGEQSLPQVGVYGVKPSVEAALGEHALHVAVLPKKQAGFLDVAAEEGRGYQSDAHNLGGRHPSLRVIAQAHRFGKLFAQAVGGGYGIVHRCPPGLQELGRLRTGRILINPIGGNLGYIAVVLNAAGEEYLFDAARTALDYGFDNYKRSLLVRKGEVYEELRLPYHREEYVELVAANDVPSLVGPSLEVKRVVTTKEAPPAAKAGQELGTVEVLVSGKSVGSSPLIVERGYKEASLWARARHAATWPVDRLWAWFLG